MTTRSPKRAPEESEGEWVARLREEQERLFRQIEDDEMAALDPDHGLDAERRISDAVEQLEELTLRIDEADGSGIHD
jgi:hypothetical protein